MTVSTTIATQTLGAVADIWRYQFHLEVWILLVSALAMGWYIVKVIAPNAVPQGQAVLTTKNKLSFAGMMVALWLASDWPMHDIAEEYLYSVHMVQHLIISLIIPPLLLSATPEWLARLIVGNGGVGVWIKRMAHPVAAGVLFNAVVALTHVKPIVNFSVENGPFHYAVHLVVFLTGVLMWIPVISPIRELRLSGPGQMVYLFLMSVLPTVPGGWLTFADGALYSVYDHDVRLWGIDVTQDQQAAGLIMKVIGGAYLWVWITTRFVSWSREDEGGSLRPYNKAGKPLRPLVDLTDRDLTYEDVQEEFDRSGQPPTELV